MMHKTIIAFIFALLTINSTAHDLCCKEEGEKLGLSNCRCRNSCSGPNCRSGRHLGIRHARCGHGVCCCGDQCYHPERPDLDSCDTEDPTIDPTNDPTNNPSKAPTTDPTNDPTNDPTKDPTSDPTNDPTSDPTSDPTNDPTIDPTNDPTTDPTNDPTNDPTSDPTDDPTNDPTIEPTTEPTLNPVVVCDVWTPDTSAPTSVGGGGVDPPFPDPLSPQLCQVGKSGEWNSLDKWYAWDCTCFDIQTLFKLTQVIQNWYREFEINFNDGEEGRFEQYFENYAVDDIMLQTSLADQPGTAGPSWPDLDSLTSCDPDNPGYGEFTRTLSESLRFTIVPGGVLIKECLNNGNLAIAEAKIDSQRMRPNGITETQVVFGGFILERQEGTNIWLFREIEFIGTTVGFFDTDQP